jgi:membrane protease YdiL (CAAX protease family)
MNRNVGQLLTLVVATSLFGVALLTRDRFNPWLTNLFVGLISLSLCLAVLHDHLHRLLVFSARSALMAAAIGVCMVVITHLGYEMVSLHFPAIEAAVELLYLEIAPTAPSVPQTVALIILVVAAEELVWRGVAFELLRGRVSSIALIVVGALLYTLPQLLGGSLLLMGAGLALGLALGLQRMLTGRVTDGVITHAIWSVSIFCLVPLS